MDTVCTKVGATFFLEYREAVNRGCWKAYRSRLEK